MAYEGSGMRRMLPRPMVERCDHRDPIVRRPSGGIQQHHRVEPSRDREHERPGRVGGSSGDVALDFADRVRRLGS